MPGSFGCGAKRGGRLYVILSATRAISRLFGLGVAASRMVSGVPPRDRAGKGASKPARVTDRGKKGLILGKNQFCFAFL